ncbi:hypothetical protein BKA62DRAFT_671920 [Auriculariales sp. MPI-PUGE-AT-0066]|nr:hypothetical protein BKA62DRAFT_671920 [Auriculariales sp. MPI-PUGE-AT-0066]
MQLQIFLGLVCVTRARRRSVPPEETRDEKLGPLNSPRFFRKPCSTYRGSQLSLCRASQFVTAYLGFTSPIPAPLPREQRRRGTGSRATLAIRAPPPPPKSPLLSARVPPTYKLVVLPRNTATHSPAAISRAAKLFQLPAILDSNHHLHPNIVIDVGTVGRRHTERRSTWDHGTPRSPCSCSVRKLRHALSHAQDSSYPCLTSILPLPVCLSRSRRVPHPARALPIPLAFLLGSTTPEHTGGGGGAKLCTGEVGAVGSCGGGCGASSVVEHDRAPLRSAVVFRSSENRKSEIRIRKIEQKKFSIFLLFWCKDRKLGGRAGIEGDRAWIFGFLECGEGKRSAERMSSNAQGIDHDKAHVAPHTHTGTERVHSPPTAKSPSDRWTFGYASGPPRARQVRDSWMADAQAPAGRGESGPALAPPPLRAARVRVHGPITRNSVTRFLPEIPIRTFSEAPCVRGDDGRSAASVATRRAPRGGVGATDTVGGGINTGTAREGDCHPGSSKYMRWLAAIELGASRIQRRSDMRTVHASGRMSWMQASQRGSAEAAAPPSRKNQRITESQQLQQAAKTRLSKPKHGGACGHCGRGASGGRTGLSADRSGPAAALITTPV